MSEKPVYFPVFDTTIDALRDLDAECVKDYLLAMADYAFTGVEPDMDPVVRALFVLSKKSVDTTLGNAKRSRDNGAKGGRPRRCGLPAQDGETKQPECETQKNPDITQKSPDVTQKNPEPTQPEPRQTMIDDLGMMSDDSASPPPSPPPTAPARKATSDAPPFGEVPTIGQWSAYCEGLCLERDVEPDADDFSRSFGWYEDHRWCHPDGTRYGNWHLLASTCVKRLKSDQESARRADRLGTSPRRHGNRGRASPAYQPSAAAVRADRDAEVIHSSDEL